MAPSPEAQSIKISPPLMGFDLIVKNDFQAALLLREGQSLASPIGDAKLSRPQHIKMCVRVKAARHG